MNPEKRAKFKENLKKTVSNLVLASRKVFDDMKKADKELQDKIDQSTSTKFQ